MKAQYGVDAMPETVEKRRRGIPGLARRPGRVRDPLAAARGAAIAPAISPRKSQRFRCPAARPAPVTVDKDEHPRPETTLEASRN